MSSRVLQRRRNPEQVLGSAAIVGLIAGAADSEDWELMPVFLGGALVVGALTSVAAVAVWWAITTRVPGRPWVARLGAAVSAAAASLLMLAGTTNLSIAVPAAAAAGFVAAVAAPLVGFDRDRPSAIST